MFEELPTPHIAISGPIVRRNLKQLADYAAKRNIRLRPHTKTHKSIALGRMQMDLGAIGLTVAKVGEAKVMAQASGDLLMAYPPQDAARAKELAGIAKDHTVRVGLDSVYAVDLLQDAAKSSGSTIGVLIDFDSGNHRTGVQSPAETLALARHVSGQSNLRLDGLMFYPGHLQLTRDNTEALRKIDAKLDEIVSLWKSSGLEAKVVSGGSTPTAYDSHTLSRMTEIRPGTYIYNDMNIVRAGCATLDDVAARIVCTVVSTAVPGQIVLDSGSKTLTNDRNGPAPDSGHGMILEYTQAKITKLSEEHAQVDVTHCDRMPKVGQRVSVIPNHICPCVNLQDGFWWYESGFDQADKPRWMVVDARGKVS